MAATWETQLRRMIRDTHGLGWSLRAKGVGTTQITRRWSDNSRSSTTVAMAWRRANGPQLLALIERLARMTAPVADGGHGLALAKAAELIKVADAGDSVVAIRSGVVDWPAVADQYRRHRVEVTGEVTAQTWKRCYRLYVGEALGLLGGKRAPKDGPSLLARLVEEHPTAPGGRGRKERVAAVASLLSYAVKACGADARWLPPVDRSDLIGKRADRKPDGVPLLDDQGLRIYRAIADPQWRLAWGLLLCFGLRPVELGCCRADGDALVVAGVKRNSSGRGKDRRVWALDPEGFSGMGAALLSLLGERGRDALPPPADASYWSSRAQAHMRRFVPEWEELVAEAAATGQGHLTIYSCRHGYAFRGTNLGLDHRTLSKLMGHTVSVHMQHYGRWASDESVAAAVAAALGRREKHPVQDRALTGD